MALPSTANPNSPTERARWAWNKVSEVGSRSPIASEYATHVRKLPARLQINGLGQAMAFLFAKHQSCKKAETGAQRLLIHLGERIATILQRPIPAKPKDIMAAIVAMTPDQYRRCTHELLTTAEWLKRFADGLFDKNEQDEHGKAL